MTFISALLALPMAAVAPATAAEGPTPAAHVVHAEAASEPAQMTTLDNWAWD
ncbi:hypothetical protein [Streptomyces canus]|uniref:hypothetical protein n=1 Tax=Streptomyces canus TaxID=58343 RepID=UPI001ABFB58D|nr:hypothetical protein [Streptomyces canus]